MAGENQNPTMVDPAEAAGSSLQADAGEKTGADRRAHPRLRPHELRNLQARLASGADIRLIDVSRGGAQFETDRRFLPNSSIALRLVTPDSTFVVNGRVVRSRIVRLAQGGLGYNVAVAFTEALQHTIEVEASSSDAVPAAGIPTTTDGESTPVSTESATPIVLMSAADAALGAEPAPIAAPIKLPSFAEVPSNVTPEEQAAFEASVEDAPLLVTVTASVDRTSEELRDLFNGNDW